MRIKKIKYEGKRALQFFLLCLFSFFLTPTANAQSNSPQSSPYSQSDIELMAEAARAEDLDKSEAFQQTLSSFKQELAGKYLFDEQSVARNADVAFDKMVATSGNKQLLIKQIFHALPQHVMNNELTKWQQRMDSISRAIASGADFEVLMNRYSETTTAVWMRRLDMTDEMEQVAFKLLKGQVSQPFLSPLGIHIIQVVDERQEDSETYTTTYVQRVKDDVYPNRHTNQLINKLKQNYSFTENQQAVNRLYRDGKVSGTLFTLGGKNYTGEQFSRFAQTYPLSVRLQYEAFVAKCVLDCETNHLDEHPDYKQSVQNLANKLLAQEAYNKHVRMPSQTDEAGLQAYFSTHQKDYRWCDDAGDCGGVPFDQPSDCGLSGRNDYVYSAAADGVLWHEVRAEGQYGGVYGRYSAVHAVKYAKFTGVYGIGFSHRYDLRQRHLSEKADAPYLDSGHGGRRIDGSAGDGRVCQCVRL